MRVAYKENKENKKALLMYGILLLTNGDYYEALDKFEEALKLDEDYVLARFAKIECLVKMNKINEANELLNSMDYENQEDMPEILYLKVLINEKLIENEVRTDLIEYTIGICDKIISSKSDLVHDVDKIKAIKEKLLKAKEYLKWLW